MTATPVPALATSRGDVRAPLVHEGKVRELYDLGDRLLLVVTDRISAHDRILTPPIPHKGRVLNRLSAHWFAQVAPVRAHHLLHTDVAALVAEGVLPEDLAPRYRDRVAVVRRARRIDVECVVRAFLAGGGWRQYQRSGRVNGIALPPGLRQNGRLPEPIFTPAVKNDDGHDRDIDAAELAATVGQETAAALEAASRELFAVAAAACEARGLILADAKLEFGWIEGALVLIDEAFTPDAARFWDADGYAEGADLDSLDKEPIRRYLAEAEARDGAMPERLPDEVVEATSRRYLEIHRRLTGADLSPLRS